MLTGWREECPGRVMSHRGLSHHQSTLRSFVSKAVSRNCSFRLSWLHSTDTLSHRARSNAIRERAEGFLRQTRFLLPPLLDSIPHTPRFECSVRLSILNSLPHPRVCRELVSHDTRTPAKTISRPHNKEREDSSSVLRVYAPDGHRVQSMDPNPVRTRSTLRRFALRS